MDTHGATPRDEEILNPDLDPVEEANGSSAGDEGSHPSPEARSPEEYAESADTPDEVLEAVPVEEEAPADVVMNSTALPVAFEPREVEVWRESSPTAWRKSALSHAGAMILGAAVTLGVIAATVGLTPRNSPEKSDSVLADIRNEQPDENALAQNPSGVPPFPGGDPNALNGAGVNGAAANGAGVNGAGVNGAGINGAGVNGVTPPAAPGGGGPVVPPGGAPLPSGPVETLPMGRPDFPPLPSPNVLPPLPDIKLPPLTPQNQRILSGAPPLSPGATLPPIRPPASVTRPPRVQPQRTTPPKPRPPAPSPPPVKTGPNGQPVATPPNAATTPPSVRPQPPGNPPPADTENLDAAISRLRSAIDANPNNAANYRQLEQLYRRKLVQADQVDEMERYRALADEARDKAQALENPAPNASPGEGTPNPGGDDGS